MFKAVSDVKTKEKSSQSRTQSLLWQIKLSKFWLVTKVQAEKEQTIYTNVCRLRDGGGAGGPVPQLGFSPSLCLNSGILLIQFLAWLR